LQEALRSEAEGDWQMAARLYEGNRRLFANDLWMRERVAWSLHEIGSYDEKVHRLAHEVNAVQPTVDCLLLEAQVLRKLARGEEALALLEQARSMLEWKA
jgi:hypothetical protein